MTDTMTNKPMRVSTVVTAAAYLRLQANIASAGSQPIYQTCQGVGQRGFLNVAGVRQVERLLKQTLLQ
jgi:hypothetical protein